jgi:AcrR family transcriptional regulator
LSANPRGALVPIDRRVLRTRTALYDGLVSLIRQKPYDAITVEDILQAANVGRTTFYAHFPSKDALLERSLERLRDLLIDAARQEPPGTGSISLVLFHHVAEYADVQGALAGGKGSAVLRAAMDHAIAAALRVILPREAPEGLPRELAIQHMVATANVAMGWWLHGSRVASAEDADRLFRRLIGNGLPARFCAPFVAERSV